MPTLQSLSLADLAVERLQGSRKFLLGLVDTLSDEQLTLRNGGVSNHALWVMGHIAYSGDVFVSAFKNEASIVPENFKQLFGQGSQPSQSKSDYPSRQELLDILNVEYERTIAWTKTLEGDAALQASPEPVDAITPNAISAAFTLAEHEFFHAGQIAAVRASVGMEPLFG